MTLFNDLLPRWTLAAPLGSLGSFLVLAGDLQFLTTAPHQTLTFFCAFPRLRNEQHSMTFA